MNIAEKLTTIAENQQKVFDAGEKKGYEAGKEDGYKTGQEDGYEIGKEEGYEAGQKSDRDVVWDIIQQYGKRTAYSFAFAFVDWDDTTFAPKYDIKPEGSCASLFRGSKVVDLEATLQRRGVVLDTSKTTNLNQSFSSRTTEVFPAIDMTGLSGNDTSVANLNFQPEARTIRKIICAETTPFNTSCFRYAVGLINLVIEGVIGSNGLNLQWSTKLSHDSLMSIINALADKSEDTSGTTWTITLGSTNLAKLTNDELDIAEQKGWNVV